MRLMPAIFVPVITLLLLAGCNEEQTSDSAWPILKADVQPETLVEFQPDSLSPPVELGGLQVDSRGKLYQAERRTLTILVYGPGGQPLDTLGGEGKGPGEFVGINGMALRSDTLYVFDRNMARLTLFDISTGKVLGNEPLEGFLSSVDPVPRGEGWLMMGTHSSAVDLSEGLDLTANLLAHTYSVDFNGPRASFIRADEVTGGGLQPIAAQIGSGGGRVHVMSAGRLLYSPQIYAGRIYEYLRGDDGTWRQAKIHRGYAPSPAFEILDEDNTRQEDRTFHDSSTGQSQRLITNNASLGFHRTGEYVFHFTAVKEDGLCRFGAEVYDGEMNALGYLPIESVPFEDFMGRVRYTLTEVPASDGEGGFYFLDSVSQNPGIERFLVDLTTLPSPD